MFIYKIYRFLFVFIALSTLLLCGLFLDTNKTESSLERRTLHSKPSNLINNPEEWEKYISDHFPFREKLLALYFNIGLDFDFGTDKVFIGKNKWLFQKNNLTNYNLPAIPSYQNKILLSKKEQNKIIQNLLKIKKLCDENNIHLYIMFPPDKHRIYARYFPKYILRDKRESPVKQLTALFPKELTIVPLEDALIQKSFSSKELLYYKQDSHWSEEGTFFVYQQLMQVIKKDFPNSNPVSKQDFNIEKRADIYSPYQPWKNTPPFKSGNLSLPGQSYNQKYNHFTYKQMEDIKIKHDTEFISSTNPHGQPFKIYIIGDSYASYLHSFLSATFQYVHAYRFNTYKKSWGIFFHERLKEMKEDKTNILILSISDLKLKDLLEPF